MFRSFHLASKKSLSVFKNKNCIGKGNSWMINCFSHCKQQVQIMLQYKLPWTHGCWREGRELGSATPAPTHTGSPGDLGHCGSAVSPRDSVISKIAHSRPKIFLLAKPKSVLLTSQPLVYIPCNQVTECHPLPRKGPQGVPHRCPLPSSCATVSTLIFLLCLGELRVKDSVQATCEASGHWITVFCTGVKS